MEATQQTVAVERLSPSPLNPRKTLGDIEGLTQSIGSKGVLQPLLVRPNGERGHYEIVCGWRRWKASIHAGLGEVPIFVRELDDESALEAMVVENSQRVDVHPLEEADGIAALRELGRSVEDIAAKLGRSPAYVYRRLVLRQLGEKARKAYLGGEITTGVAEELATVPAGKLQDAAADELVPRFADSDPISVADARHFLRERYRLRLAGVPWTLEDAELVVEAGACSSCPKRTGAQPALFEEESDDRCTDPDCFSSKKTAHGKRAIAEAKAAGRTILTAEEAKKVWPNQWSPAGGAYYGLDDGSGSGKTWRVTLGKKRIPSDIVVGVNPHTGTVHELVRAADVKKAIKDAPKKSDPYVDRSTSSSAHDRKLLEADKLSAKVRAEASKRAFAELVAKTDKLQTKDPKHAVALIRLVANGVVSSFGLGREIVEAAKRRGAQDSDEPHAVLERAIAKCETGWTVVGLVLELLVSLHLHELGDPDEDGSEGYAASVLGYLGVDWYAHEKTVRAELEAQAEAKAAKRSKKAAVGA